MKDIINRIYELTNSAILTPHNLLDNIMLENYKEIKYRTTLRRITCEMLTLEDDKEVTYFYEFDFNNKLEQAYALYGEEKLELFDREKELATLLSEYEYKKAKQQRAS